MVVSGRLMVDGAREDIFAPLVAFELPPMDPEEKDANSRTPAAN
jgi:hypothetical protein